jgi:hypothetical protein
MKRFFYPRIHSTQLQNEVSPYPCGVSDHNSLSILNQALRLKLGCLVIKPNQTLCYKQSY